MVTDITYYIHFFVTGAARNGGKRPTEQLGQLKKHTKKTPHNWQDNWPAVQAQPGVWRNASLARLAIKTSHFWEEIRLAHLADLMVEAMKLMKPFWTASWLDVHIHSRVWNKMRVANLAEIATETVKLMETCKKGNWSKVKTGSVLWSKAHMARLDDINREARRVMEPIQEWEKNWMLEHASLRVWSDERSACLVDLNRQRMKWMEHDCPEFCGLQGPEWM